MGRFLLHGFVFPVEGLDNLGDKRMTDNVLVGEFYRADTFDVLHQRDALQQTGILLPWEVDLGGISGHDEFGIDTHSGQEHLELRDVGVLSLVQNHTGPVKCPAPHVGQRGNLDGAVGDELLQLLSRDHVTEGIIERLEIRIQLVLEVSGQETEPLPRLDRRPGQDDPFDLPVLQSPDRQGDGQ